MEEYILVDENGNLTEKSLNQNNIYIENIKKGYFLPVVGVVIYNDQNEILLQKEVGIKKQTHSNGEYVVVK